MDYPIIMRNTATEHLWKTTEENRQEVLASARGAVRAYKRGTFDVREARELVEVEHVAGSVFRVSFAGVLVMDLDASEQWRQWGRHAQAVQVAVMRHYGIKVPKALDRAFPSGHYAPGCFRSYRSQHFVSACTGEMKAD